MNDHGRLPWARYAIEFVILFLGVFLAFLSDGHREHLQDREREREYLQAISCELNVEIALSEQTLRQMNAKLERMERFFPQVNALTTPADTIEAGLESFIYAYSFISPENVAFTSMKSSGDLRLVSNDSLRYALVRLDKSREQVNGQGKILSDYITPFREHSYFYYDYNRRKSRGLDRLRAPEALSRLRVSALEVRSYCFALKSHTDELRVMRRRLDAVAPCLAPPDSARH